MMTRLYTRKEITGAEKPDIQIRRLGCKAGNIPAYILLHDA